MKINIMRGSLIAGALALLGSVLFALPASAAGYTDCTENLCLYSAANGGSEPDAPVERFAMDDKYAEWYKETGSPHAAWDNRTKSVANRTSHWVCFYENDRLGGAVEAVAPRATADLTVLAGKVSSHKFAASQGLCFTGYERCPEKMLCIFKEPAGRGPMFATDTPRTTYLESAWRDRIRSVRNRTGQTACFYNEDNHQGSWTTVTGEAKSFGVLSGDSTTVSGVFDQTFNSHTFADKLEGCAP
ncbi:peptidase inhibitor family I36 protein [Streptomyces sp. NPDC016562]|uniref:peptidase inhibitor family I36 protein n=1 Tax=Streptomyces sp. NPDC016562 TaxID=3364966 RepID=UPI0036FC8195